MGIQGSGLSDKNVRLRFLTYLFMGVVAFGAVLYWRSQAMVAAEYVEFDIPKHDKIRSDDGVMKSKNFQLETEETSPSIN